MPKKPYACDAIGAVILVAVFLTGRVSAQATVHASTQRAEQADKISGVLWGKVLAGWSAERREVHTLDVSYDLENVYYEHLGSPGNSVSRTEQTLVFKSSGTRFFQQCTLKLTGDQPVDTVMTVAFDGKTAMRRNDNTSHVLIVGGSDAIRHKLGPDPSQFICRLDPVEASAKLASGHYRLVSAIKDDSKKDEPAIVVEFLVVNTGSHISWRFATTRGFLPVQVINKLPDGQVFSETNSKIEEIKGDDGNIFYYPIESVCNAYNSKTHKRACTLKLKVDKQRLHINGDLPDSTFILKREKDEKVFDADRQEFVDDPVPSSP